MLRQSAILTLVASSYFWNLLPAKAINVTFDASVGAVYNDVSPSIPVHTQAPPNGLNNFFNSSFLLLGANPANTSIPSDSFRFGESIATSAGINIIGGQDYKLTFDWAFRGNATNTLIGIPQVLDKDIFTLSFVGVGSISNVKLDLLVTSTYNSERGKTYTISGSSLLSGTYNVVASLTEASDVSLDLTNPLNTVKSALYGHSSAAGIDNITIEPVPFEFSPAQGLLVVGGVWCLFSFRKNFSSNINKLKTIKQKFVHR